MRKKYKAMAGVSNLIAKNKGNDIIQMVDDNISCSSPITSDLFSIDIEYPHCHLLTCDETLAPATNSSMKYLDASMDSFHSCDSVGTSSLGANDGVWEGPSKDVSPITMSSFSSVSAGAAHIEKSRDSKFPTETQDSVIKALKCENLVSPQLRHQHDSDYFPGNLFSISSIINAGKIFYLILNPTSS